MSFSICSPNRATDAAIPFTDTKKNPHNIPKALAIIALLGGLFLLLAAYQILPSAPNAISHLGGWGEALGFIPLIIGGIVLVVLCKKPTPAKNTSDHSLEAAFKSFDQTFGPLPPVPTQAEIDRANQGVSRALENATQGLQEIASEIDRRQAEEATKQATIQAYGPKNPQGKVLESSEITQYQLDISRLFVQLKTIDDIAVSLRTRTPTSQQKEEASQNISRLTNTCFHSFIKLYDHARVTITTVDPSSTPLMQEIDTLNQRAQILNQGIEGIKTQFAKRLIIHYPDFSFLLEDPPREALIELHRCCTSLAGRTESVG